MAFSTPPPPSAALRRPVLIRWWYDPVQRRRAIIAAVLALLYASGLVYGSRTRVFPAERCPRIMPIVPLGGGDEALPISNGYALDGRQVSRAGNQLRTVLPL